MGGTQRPVFIDLETRSLCDLRSAGGWNYAAHPTTRFLTVSWSAVEGEYHVWLNTDRLPPAQYLTTHLNGVVVHGGVTPPAELLALTDRLWVGHNAWTFDELVWRQLTGGHSDPSAWVDTYPLALSVGLPGGLKQIGIRLWGEGKYEEGSAVLKRVSRTVNKPVGAGELCLIAKYNVQDVRLLAGLWGEIGRTLKTTEQEQAILLAGRAMNNRGVPLDRPFVRALVGLVEASREYAIKRIAELTDGYLSTLADLNSRPKVLKWMDLMGVPSVMTTNAKGKLVPTLRKELIARFIDSLDADDQEGGSDGADENVPDDCDECGGMVDVPALTTVVNVLQLRSNALRITGGKLTAAMEAMNADNRARGLTVYWGAHTGRDAGRRIQLQNLPRPKETVDAWDLIGRYERTGVLPLGVVQDSLRITYDKKVAKEPDKDWTLSTPDDAASALIRSMVAAGPGKILAFADYAAIEARVLAWLAGESWMMDAFRNDADIYSVTAERIYGVKPANKKDPKRQVGKVVELGCGYQLGANKLSMYAAAQGIDLEAAGTTAQQCITAYRGSHSKIAGEQAGEYNGVPYYRGGFWDQLNAAALAAVTTGLSVPMGRLMFFMHARHLYIRLPSGRHLMYRNALVEKGETWYGKEVERVTYLHPRYGRVGTYGGKLAENVVQATARDYMKEAQVRLEMEGLNPILPVHDELGCELDHRDQFPRFMECMTTLPAWGDGMVLDAEGGLSPRYSKSPPPGEREEVWRNGRFHKYA